VSTPQQAIVFFVSFSTPICSLYHYRLQINMGLEKKVPQLFQFPIVQVSAITVVFTQLKLTSPLIVLLFKLFHTMKQIFPQVSACNACLPMNIG
jgi:hypothetical protein